MNESMQLTNLHTDWAVVWATLIGPIIGAFIALFITHLREDIVGKKEQRIRIFTTLMGTRSLPLEPEHVRAINMIEVVFYGKEKVIAPWKEYIKHLRTEQNDNNRAVWKENADKLLADLLFNMGNVIGYKIPALEIYRGGYHPGGWDVRQKLNNDVLLFMASLANGADRFPISVRMDNPEAPHQEGRNP
ncbi:DUF6680 family protein [Azospirillum argentinense]